MKSTRTPSPDQTLSVAMLVTNDMLNDPRVARHAETLADQGFKVTVICPLTQRTTTRETRDGYEILRVRSPTCDYLSELSHRIKSRAGNGAEQSGAPTRIERTFLLRMILAIVRICALQLKLLRAAQTTNAHVYCSNDFDTLLIGVLSARFDHKLVYDSHELWTDMLIGVPPFFKSVLRQVEKRLIKRANVVATVNEFIARELRSRYSLHRPVQVVYNYPNLPATKTQMRTPHTMKRVLYQGRYSPERGLENLVRSSEFLLPDVELAFRGYGEIEKELRALASGRPAVRLEQPGRMEHLVEAAQDADVGVVSYMPTNLCNYLASPNKLFEYIHAGLAIAASDMPFLRKVVLEDHIGLLFDPRDSRDIARVLNLVTRPDALEQFKKNIASAAKKYSWETQSPKLVRLYRELAEQFSAAWAPA